MQFGLIFKQAHAGAGERALQQGYNAAVLRPESSKPPFQPAFSPLCQYTHSLSSASWALSFLPSRYQRCICTGEELAACISQHLSGVIIPQTTATGTGSSNHRLGPLLAVDSEASQPHRSQEKTSQTTAITKTALSWIAMCQATSLRYGKQRNSVYTDIAPLQKASSTSR